MPDEIYSNIAEMILKSSMTVALTGAGISTESGIPDFRSPGTGCWEKIDPMEALSRQVLYNKPEVFYSTGFSLLESMRECKPNAAHIILAKMEDEGLIHSVITQNIDNLHFKAGSKKVMEVHGNTRTGHCMVCRRVYKFTWMAEKVQAGDIPPHCTCGNVVRPDVVLFGDSLPGCINDAWDISKECDLMIVIGSSLQVSPVNCLPGFAKKLVIINKGDTAYDSKADIVCRENASTALNNVYDIIKGIKENAF